LDWQDLKKEIYVLFFWLTDSDINSAHKAGPSTAFGPGTGQTSLGMTGFPDG
jgi:hypothetical protein